MYAGWAPETFEVRRVKGGQKHSGGCAGRLKKAELKTLKKSDKEVVLWRVGATVLLATLSGCALLRSQVSVVTSTS